MLLHDGGFKSSAQFDTSWVFSLRNMLCEVLPGSLNRDYACGADQWKGSQSTVNTKYEVLTDFDHRNLLLVGGRGCYVA